MGDVKAGPGSSVPSGNVMRADMMVQVLAITEIQPQVGHVMSMKVHDTLGTNELDILRLRDDGTAFVTRELIIDRRLGEVTKVNLATPSGRLAVRGTLKRYEPVSLSAEISPASQNLPKFPRDILVEWPMQKLSAHFTVETAEVVTQGQMPTRPFETPDFADLGIKNADDAKEK